jgi:hypothetical protein
MMDQRIGGGCQKHPFAILVPFFVYLFLCLFKLEAAPGGEEGDRAFVQCK